jgi:tetratricopeptide (TPR) repeat protein
VGNSLKNLAELYRDVGRYEEAEALYQRSIEILERRLGSNHPDVVLTRLRHASLINKVGRTHEDQEGRPKSNRSE